MSEFFKTYPHNPPHLFIDGAVYFITGGILQKQHILQHDIHKQIVLDVVEKCFNHFGWQINAWIILSNHYHLMAKAKIAKDMPTIIARVHGASATQINRHDGTPGRDVWWNYWDTCIRAEHDFNLRLNYIYWNAVKHGIVNHPEDYIWSSFMTINQQENNRSGLGVKLPNNLLLPDNFDDF